MKNRKTIRILYDWSGLVWSGGCVLNMEIGVSGRSILID